MPIDELARRAGTTVRSVRFYISQGLLNGPAGAGRAASYDDEHLARLQRILALRRRGLPLAEIRRLTAGLPASAAPPAGDALSYIDALLETQPQDLVAGARPPAPAAGPAPGVADRLSFAAPPAPSRDPAGGIPGESWRRIRLHPDVELAIREPLPPALASLLPRVVGYLKRVIEGKES
jgi:DNA-binding transcriptional MerR regulator